MKSQFIEGPTFLFFHHFQNKCMSFSLIPSTRSELRAIYCPLRNILIHIYYDDVRNNQTKKKKRTKKRKYSFPPLILIEMAYASMSFQPQKPLLQHKTKLLTYLEVQWRSQQKLNCWPRCFCFVCMCDFYII